MSYLTQPVLTAEQAKKITGGREPLLPEEFQQACKQLAACREIDEAKVWSDKASALAAWAKIYHSTRIAKEARLLKLHSYRRMAELAKAIKKEKGTAPARILQGQGFKKWEADEVMAVGRASKQMFEEAINRAVPPSPSYFKRAAENFVSGMANSMRAFYYFSIRVDASELATQVPGKDLPQTRRMVTALSEWLDEFEQHLRGEN